MTARNQAELSTETVAKHCVFRHGDQRYCVPAIAIREIDLLPPVIGVPHCHASLLGLCHQRSEFIPVFSLTSLLGNESFTECDCPNQLMVFDESEAWGLAIDETLALESLEIVVSGEGRVDRAEQNAIVGTAMFGDAIVHALNPKPLSQLASHVLEQHWGSLAATAAMGCHE